ncbi:AAA domain-containing protein [Syncephalis plumigaleata]|nr:AAA domain-containing protein [Syncephalis plumigaleata]
MQDQLDRVSNTTTNQEKRTVQMIDLPRSNWIANTSITMPKRQVKPSPALPVKPRRITINDLHAAIVEWPTNKLNEMPKSLNTKCLRAADYYSSADEYIDTMQPLSIMECWQQIANALETFSQYPLTLKAILNSRSKVDNFQEIQFNTDDNQDVISENDVIIMIEDPAGSLLINQQLLARNPPIGIVREITYQRDARIIKVRTSTRQSTISVNGNVTSGLYAFGTTWRLIKITSLTTIHREFEVLGRLSNYQLCQDILQPSSKKKTSYTQKQLDQIAYKYSINASQARAVLDSMSLERGFLLIQGPPGTGKTSTILSIISSLNEMATSNENADSSNDNDDDDNDSHRHHTRRPLLVCAPSNAAIDEIVKRLCTRTDMKNVRIVRLGNPESVHSLVKNMSLDVQAEEELERITNPPVMPMKRYDANGDSATLNESSSKHSDDWTLPTGWRTLSREAQRRMIRKMLVQRAHIICSTLSSSGHELLTSTRVRFETVLIDEASQCVELSSLIPLQYDAQRCILVGDANQLPPTVLSARAIQLNYARSLFERIQMIQPDSVDLLTVQYRMHPLISQFPSNIFYQGQIKDGPAMAERTQASWHQSDLFAPFVFFDVRNGREQSYDGRSFSNSREIDVIVGLIDRLASQYRDVNFAGRIGVITPYKEQIRALRIQCTRRFGSRIRETIDFNTIDGFQGQEKDIIFFSCVRASDSNRLGFLSDIRRMNVALTRARCSLFVVGNSETLQSDNYWGSLIAEVKERHCIYDYSLIPWLKRLPEPRTLSNLFIYPE